MAFDKSKFLEQFKAEAREHIQTLNEGLLRLEKSPDDDEAIESLMRTAHTLKGAATVMGFNRVSDIAHCLEDGLEMALNKEIVLGKPHFDIFLKCLDAIVPLLEDKLFWEEKGVSHPFVEKLCKEAQDILSGKSQTVEAFSPNDLLSSDNDAENPQHPDPRLRPELKEKMLQVEVERLDRMVKMSGELTIFKIRLNEMTTRLVNHIEETRMRLPSTENILSQLCMAQENIDGVASELHNEILQVRMLPISYLFNTFPRAMRDLAQEKGKDVILEIQGQDAHLDKAIIDEMRDAILHILRNSVDHGIEIPAERIKNGKAGQGKIILNAFHSGSQIIIEISDDGQGVDVEKVRSRAIERGLVAEAQARDMIEEQILQFIFSPGFSTAETVTEISGRGVGLDVVRDTVSKLKGMIEILSTEDRGTYFTIKLPLTLAITESLLLTVGNDVFAVPIETVVETVRISPEEIRMVESREAITVHGYILPLLRLNQLFGLSLRGIVEKNFFPVVIVQLGEKRVGILVDEVSERQEIVSKPIGWPLKHVPNIAGSTILGSGRVVLILDIPAIIQAAEGVSSAISPLPVKPRPASGKRRTILLAEDSLSTATFEKNILEEVGYSVVLAKDGQEALDKSRREKFDLVITDVLMPRMDGFELTEKLKSDQHYRNVPIIIVTTRQSEADKKRGMDAGADAYILKSDFTSEGLLDTIDRLIG